VVAEETIMPKSKKVAQKMEPAEDTQKLYARAYAARLAKRGELSPPSNAAQKVTGKEVTRCLRNLCADS
jgi:hypothetical protein